MSEANLSISTRRKQGLWETACGVRVAMYHWEAVIKCHEPYTRGRATAFQEYEKLRQRYLGLCKRIIELRKGWAPSSLRGTLDEAALKRYQATVRGRRGRK